MQSGFALRFLLVSDLLNSYLSPGRSVQLSSAQLAMHSRFAQRLLLVLDLFNADLSLERC